MNITILLGTGSTLQATLDPASVKPYGIGGSTAKATTAGGQVLDVARLHDKSAWWIRASDASRMLKGPRDLNGDEPVSWVQS